MGKFNAHTENTHNENTTNHCTSSALPSSLSSSSSEPPKYQIPNTNQCNSTSYAVKTMRQEANCTTVTNKTVADNHNDCDEYNSKAIDVVDLDKERLLYRAEGNANLVLSLPDYRKVLRLRKSSRHDAIDCQSDEINLKLCVEYIKFISTLFGHPYVHQPNIVHLRVQSYGAFNKWLFPVRPAERLDKEVYCTTGILYPDVTFLPDALLLPVDQWRRRHQQQQQHYNQSQEHQTQQQQQQQHQQQSTESVNNKIVWRDIIEGDTFSIEIKPKQGWAFNNRNEFDNNSDLFDLRGITKCRFCCMQYLKLQKKSISHISGYCPIDLFSGNVKRMERAITELIKCPQNNLAIRKNGKLIYGNRSQWNEVATIFQDIFGSSSMKKNQMDFINLIIKMLLNEFQTPLESTLITTAETTPTIKTLSSSNKLNKTISNDYMQETDSISNIVCDRETDSGCVLPERCILKKILDIQLLAKSSLFVINEIKETTKSFDYIGDILQKSNKMHLNEAATNEVKKKLFLSSSPAEQQQQHTLPSEWLNILDQDEKYLLGATALDCSIMLTFMRLSNSMVDEKTINDELNPTYLLTINNHRFIANVTVMDLDPKPIQHFAKYIRQTNASHDAFRQHCF